MFFGFLVGAIVYGAVTLVFLILSSAELLDSGMSTARRLAGVFAASVFWPATLILLSFYVLLSQRGRQWFTGHRQATLHLSHRPH